MRLGILPSEHGAPEQRLAFGPRRVISLRAGGRFISEAARLICEYCMTDMRQSMPQHIVLTHSGCTSD